MLVARNGDKLRPNVVSDIGDELFSFSRRQKKCATTVMGHTTCLTVYLAADWRPRHEYLSKRPFLGFHHGFHVRQFPLNGLSLLALNIR